MCGLPTETDEDVLAIADLAARVVETGRRVSGTRDIRCTVSIGGFVPKARTAGLSFAASDLDWTAGDGPLVQGTGEALMMALCGRRVALDELTGDGLAEFASRR